MGIVIFLLSPTNVIYAETAFSSLPNNVTMETSPVKMDAVHPAKLNLDGIAQQSDWLAIQLVETI